MKNTSELTENEQYFNRELSWIEFNARVLAEAMNPDNPLLERVKFAGIVSSNFDEFFMVRVAGLNHDDSFYREVFRRCFDIMETQHRFFAEEIVPALNQAGLRRMEPVNLVGRQKEYIHDLFHREILPLLTPIALHKDAPVPGLVNLSLYRVFELRKPSDPSFDGYAVVEIPKNLSRIITLPSDVNFDFVLLGDVISFFAEELFHGFEIIDQGVLRITRRAQLSLDEEKDEDFAEVMAEAIRSRRLSPVIRLEITASEKMTAFFKELLQAEDHMIYRTTSWIDLKSISQLAFHPSFDSLRMPKWTPCRVPLLENAEDIWSVISAKDVLVHQPYESFNTFISFLRQAAEDPDVLSIKQTLYRSGESSPVIRELERAAENGKQVTVLVELKARFDEERNIEWARRLMNAGATVLYGVAGLKTHAKACLVVRRETEGIRRYLHLSTGNYNEKTARLYSDMSLFTSSSELCADISSFFNIVTGYSQPGIFSKIEIAPFGLRRRFERLILREGLRSQKDQPGLIMAKMNSLVDSKIIQSLYRASQQGVKILLNVRGVCCLRPGIPGLSENIQVTSIVDMFLEHSRIFYFYNGGNPEVYLASSDWMPRNLDRRLEILFPVEDAKMKKYIAGILELYFKDNKHAWILQPDGTYQRRKPAEGEKPFRVQTYLCEQALKKEAAGRKSALGDLKPQTPKQELGQQIVEEPAAPAEDGRRQMRITPPTSR